MFVLSMVQWRADIQGEGGCILDSVLIDTHCHLNFKVFRSQLPAVLERARKVGVEQMVVVGSQLKNSQRAVEQAQAHEAIFAAVGVHPHHVWDYLEKAKTQAKIAGQSLETVMNDVVELVSAELTNFVGQPKVVAVGEIGLDYHQFEQTQYDNKVITPDYQLWQERFFLLQAKIANNSNKAIIIHNREAVEDMISLLTKHAYLFQHKRIVFHCCEAEPKLLAHAVKYQYFIGIDGDVTFDQAKQEFIKQVPLENLVLETDSPYITPEPDKSYFAEHKTELSYKDRVCEPRHVAVIAHKVAELKHLSVDEVTNQTTKNARQLFSIP